MNWHLLTFSASALALTALSGGSALTRQVQFRQGTHAAYFGGTVRGYGYDRYTFTARDGQKLNVSLDTSHLDAVVGGKSLSDFVDVTDHTLTLPANGTYELRILQTRAAARQGTVKPYKVTIDIR